MTFKPGTTIHESKPRPFVECAFVGCGYEALVRSKNMNLCRVHYEQQGNKEAQEHAERMGLETVDAHRSYCRTLFDKPRDPRAWMRNPKTPLAARYADEIRSKYGIEERIPGEDDEPITELENTLAEMANP